MHQEGRQNCFKKLIRNQHHKLKGIYLPLSKNHVQTRISVVVVDLFKEFRTLEWRLCAIIAIIRDIGDCQKQDLNPKILA